jgi:hypothetical protein
VDPLEHYWKLAEAERGFNSSQAGVRTLASAWLLVGAGAIGILLQQQGNTAWLLPRTLLIVLAATLTTAGMATLWVLDQLIFHRLLNSVFLVGLKMEADNPSLPPIRAMMMVSAEGKGMHRWQKLFYLLPMIALAVLSGALLSSPLVPNSPDTMVPQRSWTIVSGLLILTQIGLIAWVLRKGAAVDFADNAQLFADPDFTRLIATKAYGEIVTRSTGTSAHAAS